MKKLILLMVVLALTTSIVAAQDVYVKIKSHSDAIETGQQPQPATDSFSEQWIGAGKIAVISSSYTMILNTKKNIANFVFPKTKTYLETSIPVNYASLLPPEMAAVLQNMKMNITVKPTGKKKTILTRLCDEYAAVISPTLGQFIDIKIYTTNNVPFDLKSYAEVQKIMLETQMMGIDKESLQELGKMKGFQMASETSGTLNGVKIHQTSEAVQIVKKPAPAGIYGIPAGYVKKDKISMQDLMGINQP
jgi:hypothetical protein